MVSSGLLHAGPQCTAINASTSSPDQPGPSPHCCPPGTQLSATRCVTCCHPRLLERGASSLMQRSSLSCVAQ